MDEYIGPSITYIQKWLGLSEALAGVTLLALANGAGDVITAIVASGSDDGVAYNVGALFGAGLFVCTIVMTFTILGSPIPIVVEPNTIYRDMVFYILATLLVIACGLYQNLTWWTSVIMLLLYILLVIVVWHQDRLQKGNKIDSKITKPMLEDEEDLSEGEDTNLDTDNLKSKVEPE